jgi:hypothetical protein
MRGAGKLATKVSVIVPVFNRELLHLSAGSRGRGAS